MWSWQHEEQKRSKDFIHSCDDRCVSNPDDSIGSYKPAELIENE